MSETNSGQSGARIAHRGQRERVEIQTHAEQITVFADIFILPVDIEMEPLFLCLDRVNPGVKQEVNPGMDENTRIAVCMNPLAERLDLRDSGFALVIIVKQLMVTMLTMKHNIIGGHQMISEQVMVRF